MKRPYFTCLKALFPLVLTILSSLTSAQITSISNGNWTSPFTWDCTPFPCIPGTTDVVIIDHAVVLNTDWMITSGSITVNAGASLIEDVTARTFYMTGGAYLNNGTTDISNIVSTGGTFTNNDSLRVNIYLYNTTYFSNSGIIADVDSFANIGTFINNVNAITDAYAFYTNDTCSNSGKMSFVNFENDGFFVNSAGG